MLYLLNVLALIILSPSCDHLFSNGVLLTSPFTNFVSNFSSSFKNFKLISFEFFNKSRDPKFLGYPLTCPLTQTLGVG